MRNTANGMFFCFSTDDACVDSRGEQNAFSLLRKETGTNFLTTTAVCTRPSIKVQFFIFLSQQKKQAVTKTTPWATAVAGAVNAGRISRRRSLNNNHRRYTYCCMHCCLVGAFACAVHICLCSVLLFFHTGIRQLTVPTGRPTNRRQAYAL